MSLFSNPRHRAATRNAHTTQLDALRQRLDQAVPRLLPVRRIEQIMADPRIQAQLQRVNAKASSMLAHLPTRLAPRPSMTEAC